MKELIQHMVRMLVDEPGEVEVRALEGASTWIYELRCHTGDVGKVIGKEGKTVSALRTLVNTVAARQGHRAVLEVVE